MTGKTKKTRRSPKLSKPPREAFMRRVALSLPGTQEIHDRHGTWFNIGKKTFALHGFNGQKWILRLPHDQIRMLVEAAPDVFSPMRNATMLWLYVDVTKLDAEALRGYVTAAWKYTAPKKLQAQLPSR
jgi:hypothetical protein